MTKKTKLTIYRVICLAVCLLMAVSLLAGCSSTKDDKDDFTIETISMSEAAKKMEDKETFVLMFERDNCPFCEKLNDYIAQTSEEHSGLKVYRVETTDFELYREHEGDKTLISDSEDGKKLLELFPYFLYTPAVYQIKDGVPVKMAAGFDEQRNTISTWDVDSTVDLNVAQPADVYEFFEEGQAPEELQ